MQEFQDFPVFKGIRLDKIIKITIYGKKLKKQKSLHCEEALGKKLEADFGPGAVLTGK